MILYVNPMASPSVQNRSKTTTTTKKTNKTTKT